jgi:hypothetical protein
MLFKMNRLSLLVGMRSLLQTAVDSGDSADYAYHRIGDGTNRILGIPRDTVRVTRPLRISV